MNTANTCPLDIKMSHPDSAISTVTRFDSYIAIHSCFQLLIQTIRFEGERKNLIFQEVENRRLILRIFLYYLVYLFYFSECFEYH